MTNLPTILKPGDCLVFSRKGLFDSIIQVKTWSAATHIEVYIGEGKTAASRNGKGVAIYGEDLTGLYRVLRPCLPFNQEKALTQFYRTMNGKPYGWLSLLSFCLVDLHDNGLFCSEMATLFYRAGGFEPFNPKVKANDVAPSDFLYIHPSVMGEVYAA